MEFLLQNWPFLLLPLAAVSGWMAARKHYKKRQRQLDAKFSPDYFRGLNYLLNEQPDKAIDVFIGLLEVNSETVETHFALASLFRRRGETERAIRIHQNLIARPTLMAAERQRALFELGLDYTHAGVLDRAEQILLELLQQPQSGEQVAEQLIKIYQQQKNWQRAIEVAKQLPPIRRKPVGPTIAHFYCELAAQALKHDGQQAMVLLRQAQQHDDRCVRASLMLAGLHLDQDDAKKALKLLLHIEKQNPAFLKEALPLIERCYQRLGQLPQLMDWLKSLIQRYPHLTCAHLLLSQILYQHESAEAGRRYLLSVLAQSPSVEGLHQLIQLSEDNHPDLLPLIRKMTQDLVQKGDRYTCKNCGFSGRSLHWQCPGCGQWSTIRPVAIHLSSLEKLFEKPA